jgi:hypothetical protein
MSLVLPDESKVNDWLRERGIQPEIRQLQRDPELCPDCGSQLLELFRYPFSFYIRKFVAEALFARKLTPPQKKEAIDVLCTFIKENAERWGTLQMLVNNALPNNVDASKVHDIGEMMFDDRYGPLRGSFADVLRKIGNAEAISYLKRAARDRATAHYAVAALARLRVDGTLALSEAALKIPDVWYKDGIRQTIAKLKRRLAETQGTRSHITTESIPAGLKEWSTNLDACDLPKVLRKIRGCVAGGFAKGEAAEVRAAADDLSVDQEVRFKFDVAFQGKDTTLWLEVFCDDEDAYDLYVFGIPKLADIIEESAQSVA